MNACRLGGSSTFFFKFDYSGFGDGIIDTEHARSPGMDTPAVASNLRDAGHVARVGSFNDEADKL